MQVTPTEFGDLLRRFRVAAGLSQEQLAQRAGLSVRGISDLERGARRAPYQHTITALAEALGLDAEERERLLTAGARRRGPVRPPRPDPTLTNLPVRRTSFVGRADDQAVVRRLLDRSRLVTLSGAGGVGKTRLALETAAGLRSAYSGGVWLVELAAITDPALIPQEAARTLGVREAPGRSLLDVLVEALQEQPRLILLDNCEHLNAAAAAFAEALLRRCPPVRILATSRAALGVIGETVWWVPSLPVPEPPAGGPPRHTAATVLRAPAAQLFADRAETAHPAFALADDNAAAVAAICRRLDGLPLAIELAAARARILTPAQIAAHLDERFRLLTGGAPEAPSRQQTLRAALDWSHDLLSQPEQILLRRLAVFAGGCTLAAVEAVCVDPLLSRDALFDLLSGLVEQSLVVVEYRGNAARYRMLETIAAYAAERLTDAGERDTLRRRHRDWALATAESVGPQPAAPDQAAWLERIEMEHDNIRAALAWSIAAHDAGAALRLAVAVEPMWRVRSHVEEGRGWFAQALACPGDAPPDLCATALRRAGSLAYRAGDPEAMGALARQCYAIRKAVGDTYGMADALTQIGGAALERRDFAATRAAWEEHDRLMRDVGGPLDIAFSMGQLAILAAHEGDYDRAATLYQQSLDLRRLHDDPTRLPDAFRLLADALLLVRDYAGVRARAEEGLALCRELGEQWIAAGLLRELGQAAIGEGDLDRAVTLLDQSLAEFRAAGNPWSLAEVLYCLGFAHLRRDHLHAARPLLEESLALCNSIPYPAYRISVLRALGDLARLCGDLDRSTDLLNQSLEQSRALADRQAVPSTLESLAATAAAQGRFDHAVRLLGQAAALRASGPAPWLPHTDLPTDRLIAQLRGHLDDAAYAAAWAAGAAAPHHDAPTAAASPSTGSTLP